MNPKLVIPGGGRYVIAGKFFPLNQFIAAPSFNQLKQSILESTNFTNVVNLQGGGYIELNPSTFDLLEPADCPLDSASRWYLESLPYDYMSPELSTSFDLSVINVNWQSAKSRLYKFYEEKQICPEALVEFQLYENLRVDESGNMIPANPCATYQLFNDITKPAVAQKLICHLDSAAFRDILLGKLLFKQVMSGSLTLKQRTPDVFSPTTIFSLNWLRA